MSGPPGQARPRKASFWHGEGGHLLCDLCPRRCRLKEGETGYCGTRQHIGGELQALNYPLAHTSAPRPMEAVPLHHFWPGSTVLALGSFGANLECEKGLERARHHGAYEALPPEAVPPLTEARGADCAAFVLSEPVVWAEYVMDVAREMRGRRKPTVLNSNGYVEPWTVDDLIEDVDAICFRLKAFSDRFYRRHCHGRMDEVQEACAIACGSDSHVELVYEILPGKNDSPQELRSFTRWVDEDLGEDVPIIFAPSGALACQGPVPIAAYQRSVAALSMAREEGLRYVYADSGGSSPALNTYCPQCGELLVERTTTATDGTEQSYGRGLVGETIATSHALLRFDGKTCPRCEEAIPFVLKPILR